MKRIAFVFLALMLAASAVAQTTFYIESLAPGNAPQDINLYEQLGTWGWDGPSAIKSDAPPIGALQATATKFSSNATLEASYLMKIGNHPDFVSGTAYSVYITVPNAPSANAPNSTFVLYDDANGEGSPLDSGIAALTAAAAGDKWLLLSENKVLGPGATIKLAEGDPQPDRFYADAIRVVPYVPDATPTPTPTPIEPWPTPEPMTTGTALLRVVDDVPADLFNYEAGFALYPRYTNAAAGLFAWFDAPGAGFGNHSWYRTARVYGTEVDDATATATWTFVDVREDTYTIGYTVPNGNYWDNCYYSIECAETNVDELVIVSQNYTGGSWNVLLKDVELKGTVRVTLYDLGRAAHSTGLQMRVDAIGLFGPAPLAAEGSWSLYQ